MLRIFLIAIVGLGAGLCAAQAQEISVSEGERISIIGGCHDCHTADYAESGGQINPATALKGNPVGYNSPRGTTYAVNLRLLAAEYDEDEWVKFLQGFTARPPMPWYNVHRLKEAEMRSLHQYIMSLGEPGEPVPGRLPRGETPTTPYVVIAPPIVPGK